MLASAIWTWAGRAAIRHPALWALAVVLLGTIPVVHALSPFHELGHESVHTLWASWSPPVGLLGVSLAIAFLSRQAAVLDTLPASVRIAGELGVLLQSLLSFWAFLFLGTVLADFHFLEPPFVTRGLPTALLLVSWSSVSLRLPASGLVRIAFLWGLLWALPIWVADTPLGPLVDLGRPFLPEQTLAARIGSYMLPLGLLLVSASLRPARLLPQQ